jgi:hypothetical protein
MLTDVGIVSEVDPALDAAQAVSAVRSRPEIGHDELTFPP